MLSLTSHTKERPLKREKDEKSKCKEHHQGFINGKKRQGGGADR